MQQRQSQTTSAIILSLQAKKNKTAKPSTFSWLGDGFSLGPFSFRVSNFTRNAGWVAACTYTAFEFLNAIPNAVSECCDEFYCGYRVADHPHTTFVAYASPCATAGDCGGTELQKAIIANLTNGACGLIPYTECGDENDRCWDLDRPNFRFSVVSFNNARCAEVMATEAYRCVQDLVLSVAPPAMSSEDDSSSNDGKKYIVPSVIVGAVALCGLGIATFFTHKAYQKYCRESPTLTNTVMAVPPEFLCPLTGELMIDPVILDDGYTYERAMVQALKEEGGYCPNNRNLKIDTILPNESLKSQIAIYRENPNTNNEGMFPQFICELTGKTMEKPHVIDDGNSYSFEGIMFHLKFNQNCPKSPDIQLTKMIPNKNLETQIDNDRRRNNPLPAFGV